MWTEVRDARGAGPRASRLRSRVSAPLTCSHSRSRSRARPWQALDSVDAESRFALHTNRGAALERLGRLREAIAAYDAALATHPHHVEALHNRGVALRGVGDSDAALASFDATLGVDAEFLPSMRARTETLVALGRLDDAIAAASASMHRALGDAGPVTDRAFALLKAKR